MLLEMKCSSESFPPILPMYLQKTYIKNKFLPLQFYTGMVHQKLRNSNKVFFKLAIR